MNSFASYTRLCVSDIQSNANKLTFRFIQLCGISFWLKFLLQISRPIGFYLELQHFICFPSQWYDAILSCKHAELLWTLFSISKDLRPRILDGAEFSTLTASRIQINCFLSESGTLKTNHMMRDVEKNRNMQIFC